VPAASGQTQGFAERDDRDECREERGHSEQDSGARRTCSLDRAKDEQLRETRHEEPDENERPQLARVKGATGRDGCCRNENKCNDGNDR
jgi:hypothetical protein